MTPQSSIVETPFGKYMVWPNDHALISRLEKNKLIKTEPIIELSKRIIEASTNRVILDIGANIGTYSIPQAINSPNVSFYCFEVQRLVFYQLCGNISLNGLDNMFPFNFAVSNKTGTMEIPVIHDYSIIRNVGGYVIDPFSLSFLKGDFSTDRHTVKMKSLDSMNELPAAGLIKIDVEGHELEVLQGAVSYIKKSGFPPIFFEAWEYDWYKGKKDQLFRFLISIGYKNITSPFNDNNFLAQNKNSTNVFLTFETNSETGLVKVIRHTKNV